MQAGYFNDKVLPGSLRSNIDQQPNENSAGLV